MKVGMVIDLGCLWKLIRGQRETLRIQISPEQSVDVEVRFSWHNMKSFFDQTRQPGCGIEYL